jgi:transcriptional regulator with XRE-family HTH domain
MTTDAAGAEPQEPMAIELKLDVFEKLVRSHGWTSNAEIAAALGISERHALRVRKGKARPGIAFIAGLLTACEEAGFRRTFRVVRESAPIGKD